HAMPWLLILAGVWLVVSATRGPGRHHWRSAPAAAGYGARPVTRPPMPPSRPPMPPNQSPSHQPVPGARAQPAPPARPAGPRRDLPVDLQIKVEQIRHKADVLLGYAGRFPPFSHDLHIVRQTAADYLPRTIDAYLALP